MSEHEVDVAVIGAGIIGAACAHELTAAGLDVAVLERDTTPPAGSTGLSAAGVRVQWGEPVNVLLSLASIEAFRTFEHDLGVDSGYRPVGYLFLVPDAFWDEHLRAHEMQRDLGAEVEVLALDEAAARFVDFDRSGLAGATFGAADGVVDPHSVTRAYLARAREHGGEIHLGAEVSGIEQVGDRWRLRSSTVTVTAPTVVNAAGPWAGEVGKLAGVEVPVEPARRMIWMTAPQEGRATTPLVVDLDSGLYFRSEGERLLVGRSNPDEETGFLTGIDWDFLEPTMEAAMARFPWFAEEELDAKASWYGYYELTPDHNPVLGRSPQAQGWVDASGFSGHGVQQAPAIGRAIREEIVDGRAHTIDIDPLRIGRFLSGDRRHERHVI